MCRFMDALIIVVIITISMINLKGYTSEDNPVYEYKTVDVKAIDGNTIVIEIENFDLKTTEYRCKDKKFASPDKIIKYLESFNNQSLKHGILLEYRNKNITESELIFHKKIIEFAYTNKIELFRNSTDNAVTGAYNPYKKYVFLALKKPSQ